MNFILDVLFLISTFFLMCKFRNHIVRYLGAKIRLSSYKLALLISIPLIVIEESINTNDHGLLISIIIMFILLLEIAILLWVVRRFKIKSTTRPLLCFAIFGTLWELSVGGLVTIFSYPWLFIVFMVPFYVPMSYAYISFIPLEILRLNDKLKKHNNSIEATPDG